ncbi:hypothetical protein FMO003_36730 [Moritella sp. F3]|nr:hypothetical protein FMO001_38720 [Moritella sp. F1]GIC83393.1 hypothetical protein FMO003_36730 [Moritella sp. F3]
MIKNNIIKKMNRMTVQLLMIMGTLILTVNQVRAAGEVSGITQISGDTVEFHLDSNDWADVHYKVNGGNQRNIRMTLSANGNRFQLNNLSSGDSISYRFTYWGSERFAVGTSIQNYTLQSEQAKDTDNDGVVDSIDQCPATRQGATVNDVGCELDSDNDGVVDSLDLCPNTQSGQAVDTNGCELAAEMTGIEQVGSDSVNFYVDNNAWADVHFKINGGGQRNIRMLESGSGNHFQLNNLSIGDSIVYSFTYWTGKSATDTENKTYTLQSSSVNDADGDGVIDSIDLCPNTRPDVIVNEVGCEVEPEIDSDSDGISDAIDQCANTPVGTTVNEFGCPINGADITPLFNADTVLEPSVISETNNAVITRFADRGRDRHAKEDHFQAYDHYLSHYWTHRTARFKFVDTVAKGGSDIEITFVTEWKLGVKEFRAWYRGIGTVAEYHGNYENHVQEIANGTFDDNLELVGNDGNQYKYRLTIDQFIDLDGTRSELALGQYMEIEVSQFLDNAPEGRDNYYGTTYLYQVGVGGMVPWKTVGDFADQSSERENSYPIDESAWLGGKTTLPYQYTAEPDNHFMQMATNLSSVNGQAFVLGRRVHHTNMGSGEHDESVKNGVFEELKNSIGTHYVNNSCSSCHARNGRAPVAEVGETLDKWVFKVADSEGNADPLIGSVLQPNNVGIAEQDSEGDVVLTSWSESNGLRSPNYAFSKNRPAKFSARLAPQLVGLGLLEAVSEDVILKREDPQDTNQDGISGRAQKVTDPVSGETRLGRFGYKAGASSLKHQIAGALNTDMGVMTSVLPRPDCGSEQTSCNNQGAELSDEHLDNLVKYIALLGVRPQRDIEQQQVIVGKQKFNAIGCESCHRDTMKTSSYAPFAELRDQTIHPYTDLLLHDMGAGLADNLGEGQATGSEWRTAPLWGLGLSVCVTGGVIDVDRNKQGDEICSPDESYLHDGRARTIEEAILWHGGEGQLSNDNYQNLSAANKEALIAFLRSL